MLGVVFRRIWAVICLRIWTSGFTINMRIENFLQDCSRVPDINKKIKQKTKKIIMYSPYDSYHPYKIFENRKKPNSKDLLLFNSIYRLSTTGKALRTKNGSVIRNWRNFFWKDGTALYLIVCVVITYMHLSKVIDLYTKKGEY